MFIRSPPPENKDPATPIRVSEFAESEYNIREVSPDSLLRYGQALLVIAAADGEVSPPEFRWLVEHQRKFGCPQHVIDQYERFDPRAADLTEIVARIRVDSPGWQSARHLVYHAIQMCSADQDFATEEIQKVSEAARLLDIPDDITQALRYLVLMENAARSMRNALFGLTPDA